MEEKRSPLAIRVQPALRREELPGWLRPFDRVGGLLTSSKHGWVGGLLAFFLPVLIVGLLWACSGVQPFGDRMILAHDQWHQYYPFFVNLRARLQGGNSLFYSWQTGMGTNYLPLFAYYLASPLNFPVLLLPDSLVLPWYTLSVLLKIGFAGLFFRLFLRYAFDRKEPVQALFSTLYALCAYLMGYYWNAIWLDTVALLPMVALGTLLLLRDRRFILYVSALALSVLCSFYIGYMVCIFVALVFLGYNVVCWDDFWGFVHRLKRIVLFSLLAIGITAALTIPTYLGLQNTSSAQNVFPAGFTLNLTSQTGFVGVLDGLRAVFSNTAALSAPTSFNETLPNIFCGVTALLLAMLYCCCRRISVRERIMSCLLLLVLALSFVIRQADYVWHGFHFPNMLPFRYSFLFSFVVLVMGYRAYTELDQFRWYHALCLLPAVGLLIYCVASAQDGAPLIVTVVLLALGLAGLLFYGFRRITRRILTLLLSVCLLFEAGASAVLGVAAVSTTDATSYPWKAEQSRALIGEMYAREEGNPDPWRAEFAQKQTLNDSTFFSIPGVSVFASTCNGGLATLLQSIGLASSARGNRYVYQQTDPAINLLLGVKYLIDRDGLNADPTHFAAVAEEDGVLLLENRDYLPMGWVVDHQLLGFHADDPGTVFERLDAFYGAMLGGGVRLYGDLLPAEIDYEGGAEASSRSGMRYSFRSDGRDESRMTVRFTATRDGGMSVFSDGNDTGSVYLYVNDVYRCYYDDKYSTVRYVDGLQAGDTVTLRYRVVNGKTTGSATVYAAMFDETEFQRVHDALAQQTVELTARTDTQLELTAAAQKEGLLFTSIPYDSGWSAVVDGRPVRILSVGGGFVAVRLSMGTHEVQLRYQTPGYDVGSLISLISLLVFLVLTVLWLALRLFRPPLPLVPAHLNGAPGTPETEPSAETPAPQEAEPLGPVDDGTRILLPPDAAERGFTGRMPQLFPEQLEIAPEQGETPKERPATGTLPELVLPDTTALPETPEDAPEQNEIRGL